MTSNDAQFVVAEFGDHLYKGKRQCGFGWVHFYLSTTGSVEPEALFEPDGSDKVRVEFVQGRLTRVLGGRLTELGQRFYGAVAATGAFQIWTDNPNTHLRFQQDEVWEAGTKEERDAMAEKIREVFRQFGCDQFGEAPARH